MAQTVDRKKPLEFLPPNSTGNKPATAGVSGLNFSGDLSYRTVARNREPTEIINSFVGTNPKRRTKSKVRSLGLF